MAGWHSNPKSLDTTLSLLFSSPWYIMFWACPKWFPLWTENLISLMLIYNWASQGLSWHYWVYRTMLKFHHTKLKYYLLYYVKKLSVITLTPATVPSWDCSLIAVFPLYNWRTQIGIALRNLTRFGSLGRLSRTASSVPSPLPFPVPTVYLPPFFLLWGGRGYSNHLLL